MRNGALTAAGRKALGSQIEDARNERSMTQIVLAKKAGCHEKTVRKVIQGEAASDRTVRLICKVLDIDFDQRRSSSEVSDEAHGSYSRSHHKDYVGNFYYYRRNFHDRREILRSALKIDWDKTKSVLQFEEHQRIRDPSGHWKDRSQKGEISISSTYGLIHLLTVYKGALRLITVTKYRLHDDDDLTMHGIILTQTHESFHPRPSVAAVVFRKVLNSTWGDEFKSRVEMIRPGNGEYNSWDQELTEAERNMNFALKQECGH